MFLLLLLLPLQLLRPTDDADVEGAHYEVLLLLLGPLHLSIVEPLILLYECVYSLYLFLTKKTYIPGGIADNNIIQKQQPT